MRKPLHWHDFVQQWEGESLAERKMREMGIAPVKYSAPGEVRGVSSGEGGVARHWHDFVQFRSTPGEAGPPPATLDARAHARRFDGARSLGDVFTIMKGPGGGGSSSEAVLPLPKVPSAKSGFALTEGAQGDARRATKLWQLTGGDWQNPDPEQFPAAMPPGSLFGAPDLDRDRHYGLPTRSFSVKHANVAGTDLGVPVAGTKNGAPVIFFFFGDTQTSSAAVTPYASEVDDAYGYTERAQDVFAVPPWIRFFTDERPRKDAPFTKDRGFRPLRAGTGLGVTPSPAIGYAEFEVPTGGFHIENGDRAGLYVIINSLVNRPLLDLGVVKLERATVIRSRDEGETFDYLADVAVEDSLYLFGACAVVVTGQSLGLQEGGDVVLFYGTDPNYSRSNIYLAYCPVSQLVPTAGRLAGLRFLEHVDYTQGVPGAPSWTADESRAMALVQDEHVRELSVVYEPKTRMWLMAFTDERPGKPRIVLRWSPTPWGPWGSTFMRNPKTSQQDAFFIAPEPRLELYDPWRDAGHGNLIHRSSWEVRTGKLEGTPIPPCLSAVPAPQRYFSSDAKTLGWDGLGDVLRPGPYEESSAFMKMLGRLDRWGGPYGGFLVAPGFRWRRANGRDVLDVVYTLSTWNPYQVHLMYTSLVFETNMQVSYGLVEQQGAEHAVYKK